MEDIPRRRGRPPLGTVAEPSAALVNQAQTATETPAPAGRRRRASVGGHALKLTAPHRAGFVRRWFNDDKNRIAEADGLAYDFVTDGSIKTSDPGSRISRLVGTQANGEPLRAYLMETPVEEYNAGLAEKEAHNRQIDEAIRAGRDSTGQIGPATEIYGSGSISSGR